MKNVWVLTKRADFDGENYDNGHIAGMKYKMKVFESFESAMAAMRDLIRKYATEKNSIFDGNGRLKNYDYKSYYKHCGNDEFMKEDLAIFELAERIFSRFCLGTLEKKDIDEIYEMKRKFGMEKNDMLEATTYMYRVAFAGKKTPNLIMTGDDDGPINGIDPYIFINSLDMNDENRDYCFYIVDRFKYKEGISPALFIDLIKTTIE